MANKKKDTVAYAVEPTAAEDVTPVVNDHAEDVASKNEADAVRTRPNILMSLTIDEEVPTNIWHPVEHSSHIDTFAMNLPIGCLIMTVIGDSKPVMQYVAGIRYDEANKRFSV